MSTIDGQHRPPGIQLRLVGGFELVADGTTVPVPLIEQRLLAYLALHPRPMTRSLVAGTLWPEVTEQRATANLRAALWRLPSPGHALVCCTSTVVGLAAEVQVDHHMALDRARALLADDADPTDDGADLPSGDLLPGWEDAWVVVERERLRQLRIHGLEEACRRHVCRGATADAIDLGLRAVAADPLRESAHRALIEAHLAEGNLAEATRAYDQFQTRLGATLGLGPSEHMERLMDGCRSRLNGAPPTVDTLVS